MNLIVDIGNTRAKFAVIESGGIVESGAVKSFEEVDLAALSAKYPLARAILCSTRGRQEVAIERLKEVISYVLEFDHTTPIPIRNSYTTPATLGRDRLAAAVGAREMYGDGDMLIVDFGTAITIDYISQEGGFEGGVISTGVGMRFRALHEFTASLPLCRPTYEMKSIARTTTEAIEQGVMRGICMEVEGHISYFCKKCDKLSIIFLGGDAKFFEKRIKNAIFANQELLFVGLNRILNYNAK